MKDSANILQMIYRTIPYNDSLSRKYLVMAAPGSDKTLVGRSDEISRVEHAIESLLSGRGHILMLTGEPGIGKSTLARYASRKAADNSIATYWGFAWEAGGAPAYWPWTQILSSIVSEQDPGAELTRNLRQLLPGMSDDSSDPALQPNQAQFQLLESVRRLLDDTADRSPIVVIVEDLHAADSDSLNLLHYIARHVSNMPILIIGTFRDAEARAMEASDALWRTCRDSEVLNLTRLDESAIRQYLQSHDQHETSDTFVRELFMTTEGNPLFLTELVGLLANQDANNAELPASVEQVIRQQIALLPEETSELLMEASVLGREFGMEHLAVISGLSSADISARLAAAISAGLLRSRTTGRFRFAHVLHRDVLYRQIDDSTRSLLHLKFAKHLQQLIDDGDEDRWTGLAEHLRAAGEDYREAAIAAWRQAAQRATKRLAFADAVVSLEKALSAFGEGPRYEPVDRARLLLDCAEVNLLTGATDKGHQYCRDAFDIARTLQDAALMSEAALTWGSAIVVAMVDTDLIAVLQESLDRLPEDDTATRARVKARLAGAMQPAVDPSGPMEMAREAITLARTTNNEQVMYEVLRSAISALMDFAPAEERISLNEEFGALAIKLGDAPGEFRSHLRLMIDAAEAADRLRMNQAIDACNQLAEKIALPHYQWRASSARAMQATINGNFSAANDLLNAAQAYAVQIDDLEAKVTIPLQRLTLLMEWNSDECQSIEEIEAQLQDAYESGMGHAEFFIAPLVNSLKVPLNRESANLILQDKAIVERTFSGGDRYSLCRIGEVAAAAEDVELAERAYEKILPLEDHCATLGLMGTCCTGPVAWTIGQIAFSLGRNDEAFRLLDKALNIAVAMKAPPWAARIHETIAEVAAASGDEQSASEHRASFEEISAEFQLRKRRFLPAAATRSDERTKRAVPFTLEREGDLWKISYGERSTMLRGSKGLDILAKLVERPDADIHVLELSGGSAVQDEGNAGPALDPKARKEYETRIRELTEELEEAEEFGDTGRADATREEIDFITRELSRAFGLGGRARKSGDAAERARVNVRRRLKNAIERITEQHPDAGRYLKNTIKTGTYCRYVPM